jgi:hypothetical protein
MSLLRWGLVATLALVSLGCETSADPTTSTSTSTTRESTTTSLATTTSASPTTTIAASTTTNTGTTLPGDAIDFGPRAGDQLMVIGVSYDDVLNLRELPGTSFGIVDEIPPDNRDLIAAGNTRDIGQSFWTQVDFEGTSGWVHMGFVGFEGGTEDLTALVVDRLGDRPAAETMNELGLVVAEVFASDDPQSEVVKVVEESVGDLGEVTFDVIGLGDDAVRGLRLHLFAEPTDSGFTLRTVEVTNICGRGVATEGLCP